MRQIACHEQLNLTIRYVDNDYIISVDSISLFSLPDTTAKTFHVVVKDLLLRCNLPLPLCRGQAYDGASAMQGKRKGLATLIKNEVPAALPVHCLAHSLNLCLQDVARQVELLRDAMDIVSIFLMKNCCRVMVQGVVSNRCVLPVAL